MSDKVEAGKRTWRYWPRSLRWQLQAWQAFLSTCMLVAFGVAVYELVDANRFRQVDSDLQERVTAIRRNITEARHRESPLDRDHNRERKHLLPPPMLDRGPDLRVGPGLHGDPRLDGEPGLHGGPDLRGDGPLRDLHEGPPPNQSHVAGHLPPDFSIPPETAALFGSPTGFYFVILSRDDTVLEQSPNAPSGSPKPTALERDSLPHFRTWGSYREAIHCSGVGDCVIAGQSIAVEMRNSAAIAWLLPLFGGTVLLIGLAVGWWLITRAVRPIGQIEATAKMISEGQLSERVPVSDPENELGRLSVILNATFARLESAFERQQQFTSDAAHELRTPLAIMISEAQTALARTRNAAEYEQALQECLDTAQNMRKLTDTLLDLARLDTGNAHAQRSEVDLADVALDCIAKLQAVAATQEVTLKHHLAHAPVMNVAGRVQLVVMNLLTNAISYNRPGGEVLVTTRNGGAYATLSVADTGVGIGPADLPHIFDRFYRADKVRSRVGGHAGLGLSICKAILDASGGTIEVQSESGKGSVFSVSFPLTPWV